MASVSPLHGRTVLIVEDEPLIALDLRQCLCQAGAHVVVAHDVAVAQQFASATQLSAAVLDYRLGADDCLSLCWLLRERGVAFAFYTGCETIPPPFTDVSIVKKPAAARTLVDAVAALLQKCSNM